MTSKTHLLFHSRGKELAILSNFWPQRLVIDAKSFSCPEAYFHYAKFAAVAAAASTSARRDLMLKQAEKLTVPALPALAAKRIGGKGKDGLRLAEDELAVWDSARDAVQRRLLRERLAQDGAGGTLEQTLLATGSAVLVHFERMASVHSYWGGKVAAQEGGGKASVVGKNMLGRMWMELRDELRTAASETVRRPRPEETDGDSDVVEERPRKAHRTEAQ
jgi:ribA/ribD-fused uncharacterized protein